ncbi:hypothetical protein DID88_002080 [Monilinia fructigena]|uniref:Uncharacterized protein n=1 Tax=Monilinia fructigena TaxID=38457 RepID=A0A395IV56_9HELO|nr:hypothetical protein DID88_002080 [Monilinia fructigena]
MKINHDPLLSLKGGDIASKLSAISMNSTTSKPATERTKKARNNQKATPRSHIKTSGAEQKDKVRAPSENLSMKSQDFEIPSSSDSMSSCEQSEGPLDDKMCVIRAGNDKDYAKFVFTKVGFKSILEKVPHFKTYLSTPGSTSINITEFLGSSLRVVIQWITNGVLMDLNPRKLGRRRGLCDYPFVETYTMASTFGLTSMCDEIMDSVLKALWGEKEDDCILPDIRDLYLVYSRTKPGNPLRKLYISIFDWNLISDECNRVTSIPEISSPELWDLLKYSGHAGIDYINYARSQVTDRTFFHPIETTQMGTMRAPSTYNHQALPSREKARSCLGSPGSLYFDVSLRESQKNGGSKHDH